MKESALGALDVFAGTWRGTGQLKEGAEGANGIPVTTEDVYEWLPGGHFLIYRGWMDMGAGRLDALRVLGYDARQKGYTMRAYDSLGYERAYVGQVNGRIWRFSGETERVVFTLGDGPDRLTTLWERSEDGMHWLPLCQTEDRRADS